MVAAIQVNNVSKNFGSLRALSEIDLEIHQGEFFALLGPNGAGKTTLINLLCGLARADTGTLNIAGFDIQKQYRQARALIGVVPQELVFDPFFSVRETLRIQSGYFGLKRNDDWIDELLQNLALSDKANTNMRALSGGMKRRVLVAQALVHKPPVIVLDEPTAGVDVELRQTLWQFIKKLNTNGHTIVLTTHYLEEAEMLCNRVAMLKSGRIVALDNTKNLIDSVSGRYVKLRIEPNTLPPSLQTAISAQDHNSFVLSLQDYAELETVLQQLRQANIKILEMELQQTDLEEVFVQIMHRH